jgi:putative acyl-CoA dehydrogenase
LDAEVGRLRTELDRRDALEVRSRYLVERMALALQASILLRAGNAAVADVFCESRLGGAHGLCFGTLPSSAPFELLIERAFPPRT